MSLNAVQFDMLCLENSLMTYGRRTWIRHSRHKECDLLGKRFGRFIGKSWLDDNRGALKRNGYHRAWQKAIKGDHGRYDGSESRRQFTHKACNALTTRGIKVFGKIWQALKPKARRPQLLKTQPAAPGSAPVPAPKTPGENPFLDPNFRKKHGLKPIPPLKSD
jgi:hypothetical protein